MLHTRRLNQRRSRPGRFLAGGAAGTGWGVGLETSSVGWVSIGKSIVVRRGDYKGIQF